MVGWPIVDSLPPAESWLALTEPLDSAEPQLKTTELLNVNFFMDLMTDFVCVAGGSGSVKQRWSKKTKKKSKKPKVATGGSRHFSTTGVDVKLAVDS